MKKVLFVIDSLSCGGAEKSLLSLLTLLDYATVSVDLLLFKRGGVFETLVPKQVHILHPLPYSKFMEMPIKDAIFSSLKQLTFHMLTKRVKHTIAVRKNKKLHGAQLLWKNVSSMIENHVQEYDVAIAYSQGFPTYYVAEKVTAKKKLAWVNTNYTLAGYDRDYDYPFYDEVDTIVAVSDLAREILVSNFPEFSRKIQVVYDINNPYVISKLADQGEGYTDNFDGWRLLTIGRLVQSKGYDIAIEACKKLKEQGIRFRWYVLGEGILRDEIKQYLHQNHLEQDFVLLGVSANPYPYIKNCDIYIQTSRFEGFGLAIAEARMLNKPVVTTNFDAVHNQIIDGKNGLVVDMNADAVCDGVSRMLHDHILRTNIIRFLEAEKKGNIEEMEKIYKLVLAE